ncbi:MAG: phasin family protein [Glycocaulis sp.]
MPAKQKAKTDDAMLPQMTTMMEMGSRNMEMLAEAGQEMTSGMREASKAMQEFLGARLKKDVEAARQFADCRTPDEFWRAQCNFFEDAVKDYSKEAARMIEIASSATLGFAQPVEKAAEEALKSIAEAGEKARETAQKAVKQDA